VSQISQYTHLPEVISPKTPFFAQVGFAGDGFGAGESPVDKSVEKNSAGS